VAVIALLLVCLVLLTASVTASFLFGFQLGGARWQDVLARVRDESARARSETQTLTRLALIELAERRATAQAEDGPYDLVKVVRWAATQQRREPGDGQVG